MNPSSLHQQRHRCRAVPVGLLAAFAVLVVCTSCTSGRASSRPAHPGVAQTATGCIWARTLGSARSETSELVPVRSPEWVDLTATGDCHDNVWSVTERLGSGPAERLSFADVNTLTVVGFIPLRPGWLPAVVARTTAGMAPYYTYFLVANRHSRLALLRLPGVGPRFPETLRVGTQGVNYQYGFSCGLSPEGYLQLAVYSVLDAYVPTPHFIEVTTDRFVLTSAGRFRLDGTSKSREPLSTAFDFTVEFC